MISSSSTIIVDSKSGNLLYLPLDKLFEKTSGFPTETAKNSKAESDESNETENLVDGREFTRPVYRQGRN